MSKTSSNLARLQQRSPLDDKDVEDIARPITKPIMCAGRWNIIVMARGKVCHLAVKHRHIFQENKQVFKNLNPTKACIGQCFKCPVNSNLDPKSLSWPKQALSDVPAYALGFLWDAIVPRDHCLRQISTGGIWHLFEKNATKMANLWIDRSSGSKFMYGMGRRGTGADLTVCIVGGDTHKKNVVAYYFGSSGRYYLPVNVVSDHWTPFFVRRHASSDCLMGWSEGRVSVTARKSRMRFQRIAHPWLLNYDVTTLIGSYSGGAACR